MEHMRFDNEFNNERIIPASGLSVVGGMLAKSSLVKRMNRIPVDQRKRSEPQIKNGDIILTEIGLLVQGKTDFEDVKEMMGDPEYYKAALGICRAIPSAETLRQRLDDIGDFRRGGFWRRMWKCSRRTGSSPRRRATVLHGWTST